MRGKKVLAGIFSFALCFGLMVPSAYAADPQWYFNFNKNDKVHVCGSVMKANTTQYAKITLKKSSDNNFAEGKSVLGVRVRTTGSLAATGYYKYSTYATDQKMSYSERKGAKGTYYNLHGQVDSSSSTYNVKVWGYWLP